MEGSMSPEIGLIIAPDRTYAALAARPARLGFVRALRRPLLVAVVLGTSMALSTTRHVTPALVFSTTVVLCVVVIGQVLTALAVMPGTRAHAIGRARALDLFFVSHAPWSLWLLAASAWAPLPPLRPVAPVWLAALVPVVLTPRMIAAYFRQVHELDRRRAAVRTIVHQILTWGLLFALFGAAVAIWPRILQVVS
jgi:hypothetical protein